MARTLCITLAFLLVAQRAFSAPAAPPATTSNSDFEKLIKEIKTNVDKSLTEAKKSLNLPDDPNGEAILKAVKEQATKAEKAINDMKTKVEEEIKNNPQISEALTTVQKKLDEAQASLKKQNPDLAANAQKLTDQLKSAWDSVTGEMDKVQKEFSKKGGAKDDLENLLKNIIDRGSSAAKELQTKIGEAVNQSQKKAK